MKDKMPINIFYPILYQSLNQALEELLQPVDFFMPIKGLPYGYSDEYLREKIGEIYFIELENEDIKYNDEDQLLDIDDRKYKSKAQEVVNYITKKTNKEVADRVRNILFRFPEIIPQLMQEIFTTEDGDKKEYFAMLSKLLYEFKSNQGIDKENIKEIIDDSMALEIAASLYEVFKFDEEKFIPENVERAKKLFEKFHAIADYTKKVLSRRISLSLESDRDIDFQGEIVHMKAIKASLDFIENNKWR